MFFAGMDNCPHCGSKRRQSRAERNVMLVAVILTLVAIAVVAYVSMKGGIFSKSISPPPIPENETVRKDPTTKDARRRGKSPSDAQF
jgi:hypothetical protein